MKSNRKKEIEYITSLSIPVMGAAGETGRWRVFRPVKDDEKCNDCLLCWIFCPEATIDKDTLEIDYKYCKGCGVCATECPTDAIVMEKEESK